MASASPNYAAESPRRGGGAAIYNSVADVGAVVIRWFETLGDMTLFLWRTLAWLATRMPRRDTMIPAFYNIGVLSLPVIALTGTFIGMVLAVQSYTQFKQFGFETRLGALINLSMCRELGPVLGRHDAGWPRRECDRGRGWHDACDRADRCTHLDGREPDSLSRGAAVSWAAC